MPELNDGVVDIPESREEPLLPHSEEENLMPDGSDKFHALAEQNMAQIGQSGVVAQNNFITTTKAQDLDYLEGKRLVTLEEAVGVREVSSKSVPAGPSVSNVSP